MIVVLVLAVLAFGGAHAEDWGCIGPQPGVGTPCQHRPGAALVAPPVLPARSFEAPELVLSNEFAQPWAVRCITTPHGMGCQR